REKRLWVGGARRGWAARRGRRQIPEDALTRFGRQHESDSLFLRDEALAVVQEEEKCLVLDDRPTETAAELIPVKVVLFGSSQILKPAVGGEFRILVGVEKRAVELVAARTGLQPHLP